MPTDTGGDDPHAGGDGFRDRDGAHAVLADVPSDLMRTRTFPEAVEQLKVRGKDAMMAAFDVVDEQLEGREWVMGDSFTIADAALVLQRVLGRGRGRLGRCRRTCRRITSG